MKLMREDRPPPLARFFVPAQGAGRRRRRRRRKDAARRQGVSNSLHYLSGHLLLPCERSDAMRGPDHTNPKQAVALGLKEWLRLLSG